MNNYISLLIIVNAKNEFRNKVNKPIMFMKSILFNGSLIFRITHRASINITIQVASPPSSYVKGSSVLGSHRIKKMAISIF